MEIFNNIAYSIGAIIISHQNSGKIQVMLNPIFPPGVPIAKRIFDLLVTVPGLILISPLFGPVLLLVLIFEGQPVFFRQPRAGLNGKVFSVFKLRSMREIYDRNGQLLPDDQRISPLGRFLRATSIDELPELINVLRGEMSLVGPRPLLARYLPRYSQEQMRRHEVLPGITGWAQINGRNAQSWEERFRLDVWYVEHWSLWLDIQILFLTFWKTVRREGISQPGHATMPEFMGSSSDR
jgi:sugar transferase EpsL